MREIKFEAWDIDFKKMWIVLSLTREEQTPFMLVRESIGSESCARPSKLLKIRQYTERKDKNGKEIYEEDLLRHKYEKGIAVVKFGEGYQGEPADGMYPYWGWYADGWPERYAFDGKDVEVIGNIYENPDLLEKK